MSELRHRVSVLVIHQDKILGFHAEDPTDHRKFFFIPGGRIEANESPEVAAVRETLEETGYQIRILDRPHFDSRYQFNWDGKVNDCQTRFFLGELINENARVVNDADYHRGVAWVSANLAHEVFAYSPAILEAIQILMK